jgi:RecJ-like exonuclease
MDEIQVEPCTGCGEVDCAGCVPDTWTCPGCEGTQRVEDPCECDDEPEGTSEQDVEDLLVEALDCLREEDPAVRDLSRVRSFADMGMLTYNKGLVLLFADGSEFQVTIVRSANPRR